MAALDGSLSEREGLPPAARALAESGERLVLSAIDAPPGAIDLLGSTISDGFLTLKGGDVALLLPVGKPDTTRY